MEHYAEPAAGSARFMRDVREAFQYAAEAVRERELPLVKKRVFACAVCLLPGGDEWIETSQGARRNMASKADIQKLEHQIELNIDTR